MLREGINGFCMALADSVPGVSGGTVAFIMGFYDRFIGSIHNLAFGNLKEKKTALRYLIKLGIGWAVGMILAVLILSALFESHIYIVSSVFIGFIAGAIPLIILEEKECVRNVGKGIIFCLLGIILVAGITWMNGRITGGSVNLAYFSIGTGIRLFFIGMIAISAMFLPGISGSTLLLVFGAYIPVITAVRGRCQDHQSVSGKIQNPDGLCNHRYDDRFFLCDRDGTDHPGNAQGGNDPWNIQRDSRDHWRGTCAGHAAD